MYKLVTTWLINHKFLVLTLYRLKLVRTHSSVLKVGENQSRLSTLLKEANTTANMVSPIGLEPTTLGSTVEHLNNSASYRPILNLIK